MNTRRQADAPESTGSPEASASVCNVAAALAEQARQQPDIAAIHYPMGVRKGVVQYRSASYARLDALSDRYARGLAAYGIKQGARVALMVPPGLEFFALFFALFKAGVVPVLIDPGIGLKPLKQCLGEAEPEAFIGITRAQLARVLLRWSPKSVQRSVTVGPRLAWGGITLRGLARRGGESGEPVLANTAPDDMAAILFTSGSTGIPKGVVYRHRHFVAQVDMLRDAFGIEPGEVDLATFPPFALFDPALGMTTIVPHMDPTRPAQANPEYLVQAIEQFKVSNLFGSPALLKVLGRYAQEKDLKLNTVKRVLSAGAAVPAETVSMMASAINSGGAVHTPYGATECLPVASLSSLEMAPELVEAARSGRGICVGKPVAPNQVAIMRLMDEVAEVLHPEDLLPVGEVGEIIVHGPTTTDRYWRRETQTQLAKTEDDAGRIWHRMGDAGYFDEQGRLWFCGRKSQRVQTPDGPLFADQVEAVFNHIEGVERTALVGIKSPGQPAFQEPVLCIEVADSSISASGSSQDKQARTEAIRLAVRECVRQRTGQAASEQAHEGAGTLSQDHGGKRGSGALALKRLEKVLFHPGFPVDIRHNSKIGREALSEWAAEQLS